MIGKYFPFIYFSFLLILFYDCTNALPFLYWVRIIIAHAIHFLRKFQDASSDSLNIAIPILFSSPQALLFL
jgi:hypothetical protein